MTTLYHGSTTQNIKTLEPRHRYVPKNGTIDYEAIYATPMPAFAAAHAFAWSTDEGINLGIYDGQLRLSIPQKFKERLYVPISIYTISNEHFEHTEGEGTGLTWHTTKPVDIIKEVQYETVEEAIISLGGEIIYIH